jgi:predicted ATPase/DNA-binding SARP family transcriptional activator
MVLGPLAASHAGVTVKLAGLRQRQLLAALLAQANFVVPADRLIDILWGRHAPVTAPGNLHNQVWRLRAALEQCETGMAAVVTEPPGYVLRVDPEAIDATRFERAVAEAKAESGRSPDWRAARLGEALGLWRGPAFAEFAGDEFGRFEAMRLEELRLVAVEEWFDARLALGRHSELIGEIEAFTAEHPLRERPRGQLMVALSRSGRQADALAVYRVFHRELVSQLGLEPSPTLRRCHQEILNGETSASQPPAVAVGRQPPGNLRLELSELVGRADDIALALATLRQHRVVTMTGVGGVGKTRLALRAAADAQDAFPHGVWICELATVPTGGVVPSVLAGTLGLRAPQDRSVTDGLVGFLRAQHVLLVIDNCEHVLDNAAHMVDTLVRDCPGVTVLATSREPLGVDGEHVLRVRPLAIPPSAGMRDVQQIGAVPSVALFVDRAAAVVASFDLGEHNVDAVSEICRRLDGLPLAIELAATRLQSMSVSEVAARLERRLQFLHSNRRIHEERHRTLGAVIDWSYRLLDPAERSVFDRLSVFAGAFTLDAAVESCADLCPAMVVDVVTGLVYKSMLAAETGSEPTRFTMLETLRIYGRERLARSGQPSVASTSPSS